MTSRESTSEERVLLTIDHGIAEVKLNRPDKRNALDLEMFEALINIGKQISLRRDIRVVILCGEGPSFCAGLDFMSMMSLKGGVEHMLSRDDESPANLAQRAAWIWVELPIPVIAALQGAVYGGGLQVALGADMRFVAPDTQLSVMETKWGLCPDMSLSKTLTPLVGLDVAKRLTYTGEVVNAERALEIGLVTEVCDDPMAEARSIASRIAARSPHAIRACKTLLNEGPRLSVQEAFQLEESLQRALIASPNQVEAMQANFMKRAPVFQDP